MQLSFTDLFIDDGDTITAKKNIRVGALMIPEHHRINPNDPTLGLPINDWRDKRFEVDVVDTHIIIQQVI